MCRPLLVAHINQKLGEAFLPWIGHHIAASVEGGNVVS